MTETNQPDQPLEVEERAGDRVAAIWINPTMLEMLLGLPDGMRVVACEGHMFPTGMRVVVQSNNLPVTPPDTEPPIVHSYARVAVDDTGRRYVAYEPSFPDHNGQYNVTTAGDTQ